MKTEIHFKDGHVEVMEDAAPTVDVENQPMMVGGLLEDCTNYGDDIPVDLIEKVVFIP